MSTLSVLSVMSVSSAVQQKEMDFLPDHDHAGAVSPEFVPAFLNKRTGQVELPRWDWSREPKPEEAVSAEMSRGSVLIYSGSVVHGGDANVATTDRAPRAGLGPKIVDQMQ